MGTRQVELTQEFDEIDDYEEYYQKLNLLKYVSMLFVAYLFWDFIGTGLTGFNFLFMSTKELKLLEDQIINDKFIPKDYDVSDIAS